MLTVILLPLFLVTTLAFGYLFSFVVLGERRIFAVVAFAVIIGVNGYNFFVNLSSYFLPFDLAPGLVLAAMAAADVVFLALARRRGVSLELERGGISLRQMKVLFALAAIITLLAGTFALRSLGLDDLSVGHLSLVSTILEGNFPVMDPAAPDHPVEYHYGSDLLTAALAKAASVPPWLGYDVQIILFSGAAFLMAFVLAFDISGRWRGALIAALLMLLGSGLTWLRFTEGIEPLWRMFALGEEVYAPWKFLAAMTGPRMNSSILVKMFNHNAAVGFPVMLLVLVLYLRMAALSGRQLFVPVLVIGIAFGYLALNLETNFVILLGALIAAIVAVILFGRRLAQLVADRRGLVVATLVIMAIGLPLAFYQGGILSVVGAGDGHSSFTLARNFLTLDFTVSPWSSPEPVRLFSWTMLEEFGLVLALFIPALAAFRRDPKILFLALIAVTAFATPFIVLYETRPHEIKRLFGISTPFMFFVGGLYLDRVLERAASKKWLTQFIWLLVLLGVSWSAYYLAVYVTTPYGYIGQLNRPLIERPSAPAAIDARAYEWIRQNTTIADRFFPFNNDFIRDTGRFTPGFFRPAWPPYPEVFAAYERFLAVCDRTALDELKVNYLYVSPGFPIRDFEKRCLPNLSAERVWQEGTGDQTRSIYRLR